MNSTIIFGQRFHQESQALAYSDILTRLLEHLSRNSGCTVYICPLILCYTAKLGLLILGLA